MQKKKKSIVNEDITSIVNEDIKTSSVFFN